MNTYFSKLNDFFNFINCTNIRKQEDNFYIKFEKEFNCDKIENVFQFNFEEICNSFSSSIAIRFWPTIDPTNSVYVNIYNNSIHIDDLKDMVEIYDKINIEISINKIELLQRIFVNTNIVSDFNCKIYSDLEMFTNAIRKTTLQSLEQHFFSRNKKTVIIILNNKVFLENEFTLIWGDKKIDNLIGYINSSFNPSISSVRVKSIIDIRNDNCHWIGETLWLTPEYIFFDFENQQFISTKELEIIFLEKSISIILAFISNYTNFEEEEICNTINGQKKIIIKHDCIATYSSNDVLYLYKLYQWSYAKDSSDRVTILRNIITIFLCEQCNMTNYQFLLKNIQEIADSVYSNFEIYLQENVKQYFTERHRIKEMISSKSFELIKEVNSIIGTMNSNLLSTAGIVLAATVGYSNSLNLNIIKLAIIVYVIYISCIGVLNLYFHYTRYTVIKKDYDEHIKTFKKILIPRDVPEYKGSIMEDSARNFWIYWIVYLISILLLSSCGVYILLNVEKVAQVIKTIPIDK